MLDVYPDVIAGGILLLPTGIASGREAARGRLPARPGGNAHGHDHARTGRATRTTTTTSRSASSWQARGSSSTRRRIRIVGGGPFPHAAAQSQPDEAVAVQLHHPPARAHAGMAVDTLPNVDPQRIGFYGLSYGGKTAVRVPPDAQAVCPVDLLRRLQRMDPQERHRPTTLTATCSPANTRWSNGTWDTRPTMPSWPC